LFSESALDSWVKSSFKEQIGNIMSSSSTPFQGREPAPIPRHHGVEWPVLGRAGLHEFYSGAEADSAAMAGFALANAGLLLREKASSIIWVRHDLLKSEAGRIYPPGLLEFKVPPSAVTLVCVHDVQSVLQAGLDAARCAALATIMVEFWGETKAYDLTASRRLNLAAKTARVPVFLLRHAAEIVPSAAETRWRVKALLSRPIERQVPGPPAFEVSLLRHRGGDQAKVWSVEWNSERAGFETRVEAGFGAGGEDAAALSGALLPLSPLRAPQTRKAG
jgi:protein ImuA